MIANGSRVRGFWEQHRMLDLMAAQEVLEASDVNELRSQLDPPSTTLSDLKGFEVKANKTYSAKIWINPNKFGMGMYVLASDTALAHDTFCKQVFGDEHKANFATAQDHEKFRNAELKSRGLDVDFDEVQALIKRKIKKATLKLNSIQQQDPKPNAK